MLVATVKSLLRPLVRPIRERLKGNPDHFLKCISGVIHVGANVGQERDLYKSHDLNVVWVEPIPEVFSQLESNILGYEKQIALQALVTDIDSQEYEFHVANNCGASSSILDLKQHKDIWPQVHYVDSITLESITLSTLIEREDIDINKYQALVMDTQGSELLVLYGSVPIIKHFQFIKLEVPDFESYEGCCQLPDIDSFMNKHGYRELSRSKFASKAEGGSYFDIIYKNSFR